MSNSLDIETTGKKDGYALEPWRYPNDGRITSVAVAYEEGTVKQIDEMSGIVPFLETLSGRVTWAHNAGFDIAWMLNYAPRSLLNRIQWRDTMLAAKWLLNGQKLERRKNFGLDLDNLVTTFMKEHALYGEFHDIKAMDVKPGENPEYWLRRGQLDAIMTKDLGELFWSKMPDSIRRGYVIECRCLVPIAESWLRGIKLDVKKNDELRAKVTTAKKNLAASIGLKESTITSPKQLNNHLFNVRGFKATKFTPKGAPSADKDALMELYYQNNQDPELKAIMSFKNLAVMESKFINGIDKCTKHNNHSYSHASPRLFGTITGRMTYSNKTLKKYFIGLAQHQIPRQGPVKGLLICEDDEWIVQFDAAAQELRFIGQIAREKNIIQAFNNGTDLHSDMAADISGWSYEKMMDKFHHKDDPEYVIAYNFRQAGKLTNLSCQYRIGAPALARKFFSTYQIFIDKRTSYHYLNTYKRRYPGVVTYWDDAIRIAKERGYAESIGGRRFRIDQFNWMGESNAINHPIQGSGADHMEVAISAINEQVEDQRLLTVMHDGIYWAVKRPEVAQEMAIILNSLDFQSIWDKEIYLPLPFDGEIGKNFKELKEFTYEG